MRNVLIMLAMVCGMGPVLCRAQEAGPADKVQTLITQLTDDDPHKRVAAADALARMGESARPAVVPMAARNSGYFRLPTKATALQPAKR